MPQPTLRALARWVVLGAVPLAVGCGGGAAVPVPTTEPVGVHAVQGKVTFKGESVPWGFVVFFNPEIGLEAETGSLIPVGVAPIHDGRYAAQVPAGHYLLAVATAEDADPAKLMQPTSPGAPPGLAGPGGPPGAGPPGGPPALPPPPTGGPGVAGPPGLPAPPMPGQLPPNPVLLTLTPAQKQLLKDVHAKYGSVGKSPLFYTVKDGAQTLDLVLK